VSDRGYRGLRVGPKSSSDRVHMIATMVTAEEAAALDAYSRARDLSVAGIIRQALREVGAFEMA
jgi:hypothetical protein